MSPTLRMERRQELLLREEDSWRSDRATVSREAKARCGKPTKHAQGQTEEEAQPVPREMKRGN